MQRKIFIIPIIAIILSMPIAFEIILPLISIKNVMDYGRSKNINNVNWCVDWSRLQNSVIEPAQDDLPDFGSSMGANIFKNMLTPSNFMDWSNQKAISNISSSHIKGISWENPTHLWIILSNSGHVLKVRMHYEKWHWRVIGVDMSDFI